MPLWTLLSLVCRFRVRSSHHIYILHTFSLCGDDEEHVYNSPVAVTSTTHQQANTQQIIKQNTWRPHTRIELIKIIIVIRVTNHYNYYIRVFFFCRLHFEA